MIRRRKLSECEVVTTRIAIGEVVQNIKNLLPKAASKRSNKNRGTRRHLPFSKVGKSKVIGHRFGRALSSHGVF